MKELGKLACVVGLFITLKFVVLFLLIGGTQFFVDDNSEELNSQLVGYSTFVSSLLTLIILYLWRPIGKIKDAYLKIPFRLYIALIVLGFLGMAINSFILSLFVDNQFDLLENSKALLLSGPIGIFSVVVLVPIVEELVFRKIFIESLTPKVGPMMAIIFSSLIFGILHGASVQILGATLLGLLFGWIYFVSKSIVPSIIVHTLNNGFFIYSLSQLDSSNHTENIESLWSVQSAYGWLVTSVTVVIFVLLYKWVSRNKVSVKY